jgi:glycosyltransferase involved in cell wall biosynthesis
MDNYGRDSRLGLVFEREILLSTTISVVIPFHNGSAWIERALKSALEQSHAAKEIIVVDDGSTPSEAARLQDLSRAYSFEILSQENRGQSAARNLGVLNATGDYICLLDQDDFFLPKHIELLLTTSDLGNERFGFSYGDLLRVDATGRIISETSLIGEHPHKNVFSMISQNMHILPSATLINRAAFAEIGGFDESLQGYEDDDLFLRFHLSGYLSNFTSDPVSAWTVNTSSTSFSESMSRSRYLYFKKLLDSFYNQPGFEFDFFAKYLFPRFAYKFADDVIHSVLNDKGHLKERKLRLRGFIEIVKRSEGLDPKIRRGYVLATWPLVFLAPSIIRAALAMLLKLRPVLARVRIGVLSDFFARH